MDTYKHKKNSMDDKSLWGQVILKDPRAIETIYRRYFGDLYRYGMLLCEDEDIVKDCIQELFVRLLSPQTQLREVSNIKAYLFVSLRNAISSYQTYMPQNISIENEQTFNLSITDNELVTLFSQDDHSLRIAQQIRKAYQKLNTNQRQAIYLRFIKELSWEEISRLLNITPHSCMNLIARALLKMRELITPLSSPE